MILNLEKMSNRGLAIDTASDFSITITALKKELKAAGNKDKSDILQRFFKTGKGEYAEGDKFLGVTVPLQRKIAQKYKTLSLKKISSLLKENVHEYRLTAVFILVALYAKQKDEKVQKEIVDFYLNHIHRINSWDLVDSSAHKILGPYLFDRDKAVLYDLAKTDHLWSQRVAIMSTYYFIKNKRFIDTLKIAEILLNHKHDLIHKAVGWMLREIGNIDVDYERKFLDKQYQKMPRTMLRYAIEKFPEELRQKYLKGKI